MNHVPDADHDDALIARALHQPDAPAPLDEQGLSAYEEVLSHLPFDEVAPPAGLEERVVAAARAARPPSVPSLPQRRVRSPRGRSWRTWTAPAVAAAAAAAAVVLVVTGPDDGGSGGGRDATLVAEAGAPELEALLADPGARVLTLAATDGQGVGRAVLGPDGTGRLHDLALPALDTGETYWLWITTGRGPVRVGDLGSSPSAAAFEVEGEVEVDGAAISAEPAGASPTEPATTVAEGRFADR